MPLVNVFAVMRQDTRTRCINPACGVLKMNKEKRRGLITFICVVLFIIGVVMFAAYQANKEVCLLDKAIEYCADNGYIKAEHLVIRDSFVCIDQEERLQHLEGKYTFYFTDEEKEACNV